MKQLWFFIVSLISILSCNNPGSDKATQSNNSSVPKTLSDSLYKAAMDGHDLGMAKMGEIARYQQLIKHKLDSLAKSKVKSQLKMRLDSALNGLTRADEAMNRWMQEFDPDKAGSTETEKARFYSLEKEKIDSVNARILESLEAAKRVAE